MYKHSPNEKVIVYGPNGIQPNGKDIMAPMEYNIMVYSPNGNRMVLWRQFLEVVILMVKD